jgi:endonuclease/exonuclease/phosphatase (EEP) superfamily protein YafD
MSFLAESIRMNPYPSLVLGDFNTVSWDPMLTDFEHSSHHQRLACGFQATYPTDHDIPLIPIDHIFYNQKLLPVNCNSFKISGSDHRGLYASFTIKD